MTKDELLKLIKERGGFYTISFWRNNPAGSEYNFSWHSAKVKSIKDDEDILNTIVPWISHDGRIYFFDKDFSNAHITPIEYLTNPIYQNYY